jgi:hypothetical protein
MLRNAINKVLLLAAPTQITDHVAATDVRASCPLSFVGPFWKALRRGLKRSRAGPALPSAISMRPCGSESKCFPVQDDGVIPNNPKLPFVLYRSPVRLSVKFDPAAVFEKSGTTTCGELCQPAASRIGRAHVRQMVVQHGRRIWRKTGQRHSMRLPGFGWQGRSTGQP